MSQAASRSVRVRVPATSANLGPGFDALGLALTLYDEAVVTLREDHAVVIDIDGLGSGMLPRGEEHMLLRSLRSAADQFGVAVGGVEIRAHNAIPQGRGLGSSAATITAGVAAAWMLVPGQERLDPAAVLAVAASIEGHPDNVAACVYGGLTISWLDAGCARAAALPVHPNVRAEVFLPSQEFSTDIARGLLPSTVAHSDAAFNAGRSALLVHALTTAPEFLLEATEDRLHQPYRAAAMPDSMALLVDLRRVGIAAVMSGAGPSVLALTGAGPGIAARSTIELPSGWTRQQLAVAGGVEAFEF